jgi:hypothetical protein
MAAINGGREDKIYFPLIQLGSPDREAQLAKICRHVRADPMFRHLQSVMDLRIVVEKLRHLGQHRFDLLVAGTCSSERHDAY